MGSEGSVDTVFRWHCPVLCKTFERRTASGKDGMGEVPRWPTEPRRL